MSSARYYAPSGRFSAAGLAKLLGATTLVAALGGALYGAVSRVNPFIYVNMLGVLFLGYGLGALIESMAKGGKIRSTLVLAAVALYSGLVSLYFAWIFYLYALTWQLGEPFWAFNPMVFAGLVMALFENGAWSMSDFTPTGWTLVAFWAVEAAIMVATPLHGAWGATDEPFCEDCEEWTEVSSAIRVGCDQGRDDEIKAACERGDFSVFADLPLVDPENSTVVSRHSCPTCRSKAYLQVQRVHIIPDGSGGADENRVVFVKYLQLSPTALGELDAVFDRLLNPPEEPAAE